MSAHTALGWKHATGILLREDRIVVSQGAGTPLGVRQVTTRDELIGEDGLAAAVQRVDAAGGLRGRLVCGVDPRLAYSLTRKLSADEADRETSELLCARLGLPADALVTAMESIKLPGGVHQVITASPRPLASAAFGALAALGRRDVRLVSVPWLLYHKAAEIKPRPRKRRCEVRVLPGEEGSMAILAWMGQPVASRMFEMASPEDVEAIGLAVLALHTLAREGLGIPGVDGVVLHMGEPAAALVERVEQACGIATLLAPRLPADPEPAAAALAGAGIRSRVVLADQFRELAPPAGLRQNFPRRSAAALLVAFGGLGWTLHSQADDLNHAASRLEKTALANAKHVHVDMKDVPKIHDKLRDEVALADSFLVQRVTWSDLLREVPQVLPPTMTLLDFDGKDPLHLAAIGNKKKEASASTAGSKGRELMIAGEVSLKAADPSPPEVAQFTAAVHASPCFARTFPRVDGANVRLLPVLKGLAARITLVCLPENH